MFLSSVCKPLLNTELTDTCVYVNPGNDLLQLRSHIPNVLKDKPDIVVLQAGSIDVMEYDVRDITYEYRKTIDKIKSSTPDTTTIFLSSIPKRHNRKHEQISRRVNSFIRNSVLHDPRLHIIENNNITSEDLDSDGIHLSYSGKDKLTNNINRQINNWIKCQDVSTNRIANREDFPPLSHQNNR